MSDIRTEDWAGEMGQRWLDHLDQFESMLVPVGEALIAHAGLSPGDRVADIGCGGAATTFAIARAVAPNGHATGLDIAPMLIARAKQRLVTAGGTNVDFQCLDAETDTQQEAPFDRLFSRFGVMFFNDTRAAFANMRHWLRPGGEIIFACWASPDQNPWMGAIALIVGRYIEMPQRDPEGPGPFRLSDPDTTRAMLEKAGFKGVSSKLWQGEQPLGGEGATPAEAADFALAAMSIARPLAEAGSNLPDRVRDEIIEALRPFHRGGSVLMKGAAWFMTARNPG